jgi:hypothetical protein
LSSSGWDRSMFLSQQISRGDVELHYASPPEIPSSFLKYLLLFRFGRPAFEKWTPKGPLLPLHPPFGLLRHGGSPSTICTRRDHAFQIPFSGRWFERKACIYWQFEPRLGTCEWFWENGGCWGSYEFHPRVASSGRW